jgi:hypothetical protein
VFPGARVTSTFQLKRGVLHGKPLGLRASAEPLNDVGIREFRDVPAALADGEHHAGMIPVVGTGDVSIH